LAEQDNRSGLAEGVKLQINCRSRQ
jgi:hypothetical protein